MKYKVLAFDIDGTLTNSEKKITDNTKNAIKKAIDKGLKVVIASGRPIIGVWPIARELELDKVGGYILSLNGGLVVSCADGKVIEEIKVPKMYYEDIIKLAYDNKVNIMTYENDDIISENIDDKYLEIEGRINGLGKKEVDNLLEHLTFEVPKFLMLGDGDYLAEVEKVVAAKLSANLDVYRSEPFFLEILPKGVNKAKALDNLLKHLGVEAEELMAFGDGYNDLTMIEYAGFGVAMSNGNELVKLRADYVAPSNDEDGIVEVLEKFVLD